MRARFELNCGNYHLARTWLGLWRWRLAGRFGGRKGLAFTQASARFAARQRLRELSARRARRLASVRTPEVAE
jgi:hypothetical protein